MRYTFIPEKVLIADFLTFLIELFVIFRNIIVLIIITHLCITLWMLKTFQHTLNEPVYFKGIGLHTGKIAKLKVVPERMIKE